MQPNEPAAEPHDWKPLVAKAPGEPYDGKTVYVCRGCQRMSWTHPPWGPCPAPIPPGHERCNCGGLRDPSGFCHNCMSMRIHEPVRGRPFLRPALERIAETVGLTIQELMSDPPSGIDEITELVRQYERAKRSGFRYYSPANNLRDPYTVLKAKVQEEADRVAKKLLEETTEEDDVP